MAPLLLRLAFPCSVLIAGCAAPTPVPPVQEPGESAPVPATYIGELVGAPPDTKVAVVVAGDRLTAFVCSPDPDFNRARARWFEANVVDGSARATDDADGTLTVVLRGPQAEIALTAAGKTYTAKAEEIGGADAGLYRLHDRVDGADRVVGWIRMPNRSLFGSARVGGSWAPAPAGLGGSRVGLTGAFVKVESISRRADPQGRQTVKVVWSAAAGPGSRVLYFHFRFQRRRGEAVEHEHAVSIAGTRREAEFVFEDAPADGTRELTLTMSVQGGGSPLPRMFPATTVVVVE